MRGFHDEVGSVDERSSERMNFRTQPQIMNAAYGSAMETIAAHERTRFSRSTSCLFSQHSMHHRLRLIGCRPPLHVIARRF
jgi:hypothetical protein